MATIAVNRRARYKYRILETWEVGIVLTGQETKAVKSGRVDLSHAFVTLRSYAAAGKQRSRLDARLINCYVPKYDRAGDLPDYDPRHPRRLLFKRAELSRLLGLLEQKGLTVVPLSLYTRNHLIKLTVGLAKGKTAIDKRDTIREREVSRDLKRRMGR